MIRETPTDHNDGGYVLALGALLIIPLMIAVGFAVDLGAWLAQANEEQRAADAASLAGVIYLPDEQTAETEARRVAGLNGYCDQASVDRSVCTAVTPGVTISVERITGQPQLKVSITEEADLFFAGVVLGDFEITRDATAEYTKPVPLGSPGDSFGNDPGVSNDGFWAAIQGPHTHRQWGDPFATECRGDGNNSPATTCDAPYNGVVQPDFRWEGYLYAVEVPETTTFPNTLRVQVYDPACYTSNTSGSPAVRETCNGSEFNTRYELYRPSGVGLAPSIDPSLSLSGSCTNGPGARTFAIDDDSSALMRSWWTLCEVTVTQPGTYVLQVRTSDGPAGSNTWDGWGYNGYSLRSSLTLGGTPPRLYALDDFSIWSPEPGDGQTATFYLAEIGPEHRGKKLLVDMFDPGDGNGTNTWHMKVLGPGNSTSSSYSCLYSDRSATNTNWDSLLVSSASTPPSGSDCSFITKNQTHTSSGSSWYNDEWVRVEIDLPDDYSCASGGTDCWWKVYYDFEGACQGSCTGTPRERTTWRVQIIGDPVHLID